MRGRAEDDHEGPLDSGLQVERTWLAWGRTALSFVAAGALLMHAGRSGATSLGLAPGLVVVGCGIITYLLGRARHLELRGAVRAGRSVTSPGWPRVVTACATVSALVGFAMALVD